MTHHPASEPEDPHLLAINKVWRRNIFSEIRFDGGRLSGFVAEEAVENHIDNGPVVSGSGSVGIASAESRCINAETQYFLITCCGISGVTEGKDR
jgi:hypothetical protein